MTALTFFPVDGYWYSGDAPDPKGSTGAPRVLVVRGYVDLIPRVPSGFSAYVNDLDVHGDGSRVVDTSISFPPRTARIWNGRLSTINILDTPTIQLLSETSVLGLTEDNLPETDGHLVYDVKFREIVFNEATQRLSNFAFRASMDTTPVVLTDPALVRLPYEGP